VWLLALNKEGETDDGLESGKKDAYQSKPNPLSRLDSSSVEKNMGDRKVKEVGDAIHL